MRIQAVGRGKMTRKDEEKKQLAAVKIQSINRGKTTRQDANKKQNAAVKIQSAGRAKKAKSKVQLRREEEARRKIEIAAENAQLKQAKKNAIGKVDKILSTETEAMRRELSTDQAAAKVQAVARGKLTRVLKPLPD